MDKAFWEALTLESSAAGRDMHNLWACVCSEAKKWQWLHHSARVADAQLFSKKGQFQVLLSQAVWGWGDQAAPASLRSEGLSVSVEE